MLAQFLLLLCTAVHLVVSQNCIITPSDNLGDNYRNGTSDGNGVVCSTSQSGTRMQLSGFTRDSTNNSCSIIPNVQIEVWQTTSGGSYGNGICRSTITSDPFGRYSFSTVVPGLHDERPRHIHFRASKAGYNTLISQLYFSDDTTNCDTATCSLRFMRLNLTSTVLRSATFDIVMVASTDNDNTNTVVGGVVGDGDDDATTASQSSDDDSITGAIGGLINDEESNTTEDTDSDDVSVSDTDEDDDGSTWWPALVFPLLFLLCCSILLGVFFMMQKKKKKRNMGTTKLPPPGYAPPPPAPYVAGPPPPVYYHSPNPNPTPAGGVYGTESYVNNDPITVYEYDYPPVGSEFAETF